jgi:predicted urease superfamily metal-dependent hydrolase
MVSRSALFILILFSAAGGFAILPPDAEMREPELRARAYKVREQYEERIEKRRALATRQYEQATADIGVPPWEIKRRMNGEPPKRIEQMAEQQLVAKKTAKKRILVSIVLLIIIGCTLGWVKHATREVDL